MKTLSKLTDVQTAFRPVLLAISALALSGTAATAQVVIDDFHRAQLGPDWEIFLNPAAVRIQSNEYVSIPEEAPQNTVGSFVGFTLSDTFSASVSIRLPAAGSGGVAFNIQNDGADFYAFCAYSGSRSLQLIKYTNGVIGGLAWYGDVLTDPLGTGLTDYYTLSVHATAAGSFELTLVNDATNAVLFSTSYTDAGGIFTGGNAGIYTDSAVVAARLFEANAVPEPATVTMLGASLGLLGICYWRKRRSL